MSDPLGCQQMPSLLGFKPTESEPFSDTNCQDQERTKSGGGELVQRKTFTISKTLFQLKPIQREWFQLNPFQKEFELETLSENVED